MQESKNMDRQLIDLMMEFEARNVHQWQRPECYAEWRDLATRIARRLGYAIPSYLDRDDIRPNGGPKHG
jgi:hypothetical protein